MPEFVKHQQFYDKFRATVASQTNLNPSVNFTFLGNQLFSSCSVFTPHNWIMSSSSKFVITQCNLCVKDSMGQCVNQSMENNHQKQLIMKISTMVKGDEKKI